MSLQRPFRFLLLLMLVWVLSLGFKSWNWNQRLVLEVETPQGIATGGSVVSIKVGTMPKWAPGQGAGGMGGRVVAGEASFVEIAPGRYLFALLDNGTEQIPYYTFFSANDKDRERQAAALETMRGVRDVPRERYPLLVTFTDIADPTTVRKVDPDNLAATFGSGVSLKHITLEITDETMTEGEVENVLGWLETLDGKYLHGGTTQRGAPLGLHGGNFRMGE